MVRVRRSGKGIEKPKENHEWAAVMLSSPDKKPMRAILQAIRGENADAGGHEGMRQKNRPNVELFFRGREKRTTATSGVWGCSRTGRRCKGPSGGLGKKEYKTIAREERAHLKVRNGLQGSEEKEATLTQAIG